MGTLLMIFGYAVVAVGADQKTPTPTTVDTKIAAAAPFEVTFRVVNTRRKPVAGAKVVPWAVGSGGGSFGIRDNVFPPITTDAHGVARVVFPTEGNDPSVRMLQKAAKDGIRSIAVRVDHPDHPIWTAYVELEGDHQIMLFDSTTIKVRGHRSGASSPLRHLCPILPNSLFLGSDWFERDGLLTIRRVDLDGREPTRWLRIIHIPEKGPALFSDLIDLKLRIENPVRFDLEMKPGVRVEGTLADRVPRPVKNGRVVAQIIHGTDVWTNWKWMATASINADGKFVIESLPADEDLQLIALCDGWVSSSPTVEEVQTYSAMYGGTNFNYYGASPTMVYPRLVRLTGTSVAAAVPMQHTANCEITVIDDAGKPLPNATVSFWPNQVFFNSGSNILGTGVDALDLLRKQLASGKHKPDIDWFRNFERYQAKTNPQGVALVRDLPVAGAAEPKDPVDCHFSVSHDAYASTAGMFPTPQATVKLHPGGTERAKVHLHRKTAQLEVIAAGKKP